MSLYHATVGYFLYEPATFDPAERLSEITVVATQVPSSRVHSDVSRRPAGTGSLGARHGEAVRADAMESQLLSASESLCAAPR